MDLACYAVSCDFHTGPIQQVIAYYHIRWLNLIFDWIGAVEIGVLLAVKVNCDPQRALRPAGTLLSFIIGINCHLNDHCIDNPITSILSQRTGRTWICHSSTELARSPRRRPRPAPWLVPRQRSGNCSSPGFSFWNFAFSATVEMPLVGLVLVCFYIALWLFRIFLAAFPGRLGPCFGNPRRN